MKIHEIEDICDCVCHTAGVSVMHCAPCCNYTYEKYISNGVINKETYDRIVEKYSK
jgi:hypothetical protein